MFRSKRRSSRAVAAAALIVTGTILSAVAAEWEDMSAADSSLVLLAPGLPTRGTLYRRQVLGFEHTMELGDWRAESGRYPAAQLLLIQIGGEHFFSSGGLLSLTDRLEKMFPNITLEFGESGTDENAIGELEFQSYTANGLHQCVYSRQFAGPLAVDGLAGGGVSLGQLRVDAWYCLNTGAVLTPSTMKAFLSGLGVKGWGVPAKRVALSVPQSPARPVEAPPVTVGSGGELIESCREWVETFPEGNPCYQLAMWMLKGRMPECVAGGSYPQFGGGPITGAAFVRAIVNWSGNHPEAISSSPDRIAYKAAQAAFCPGRTSENEPTYSLPRRLEQVFQEYLNAAKRTDYKAFAVDLKAIRWGWASGSSRPELAIDRAIRRCRANRYNHNCEVYAVGESVVLGQSEEAVAAAISAYARSPTRTVTRRLYNHLLFLVTANATGGDAAEIRPAPSPVELAQVVEHGGPIDSGVQSELIEAVETIMDTLRRDGIVEYDGETLRILDVEWLNTRAEELL